MKHVFLWHLCLCFLHFICVYLFLNFHFPQQSHLFSQLVHSSPVLGNMRHTFQSSFCLFNCNLLLTKHINFHLLPIHCDNASSLRIFLDEYHWTLIKTKILFLFAFPHFNKLWGGILVKIISCFSANSSTSIPLVLFE